MDLEKHFRLEAAEGGAWVFVPRGWRLVPEAPTQDMLDNGAEVGGFDPADESDNTSAIYHAMLAATPLPAVITPDRLRPAP